MIYGELGRYPLSVIIKDRMISFWSRLVSSDNTKLSFKTYKYMILQNNPNYKCISEINYVGRTDIWLNQNDLHGTNRRISIKQVLIDQFQQTWRAQLLQSNKGRMYLNYKDTLELDSYFKILNQNDCITLFLSL